jgi:D-beta-D-heptose 7-phosphate kinase/D-beta-D-heptose 1-phosphate adenosyltransferase
VGDLGIAAGTPDVVSAGHGLRSAIELAERVRAEGGTVVATGGCFDLLHAGHVATLETARQLGDCLIVLLNSDRSVSALKGPSRPLQDELARAAVIGAIKGVAAVTLFDEPTPLELIEAMQPDVLIKGGDYTIDQVVGAELVRKRGGRVLLAELSVGHSTSRIVSAAGLPK